MKYGLRSLLALALMAFLGLAPASAEPFPESAGHVARIVGEAHVSRLGNTNPAVVGQAVVEGMTLHTGVGGGLAVIFLDGTVMSLGPLSRLTLDHYDFRPASETFRMNASFRQGTLSLTTGSMARLDPSAVSLTTPQGHVTVQGGHALLKVSE